MTRCYTYSAWVVAFGCLYAVGALGALIAGCKPPKAASGLATLMTFMVFVWNFMASFFEWYSMSCNQYPGVWRDDKSNFVTYNTLGLATWWFSIYQLLEAA